MLLKILNLPKSAILEYKRHGTYKPPSESLKYPITDMLGMRAQCKVRELRETVDEEECVCVWGGNEACVCVC